MKARTPPKIRIQRPFFFSFLTSGHVRSLRYFPIVLFALPSLQLSREDENTQKPKKKEKKNSLTHTVTNFKNQNFYEIPQLCQMGSYRELQLQAFSQPSLLLLLLHYHAQKMCLERPQTLSSTFHS